MDTLDHTPRYTNHVTSDVSDTTNDSQPVDNRVRAARRPRLWTDNDHGGNFQPKWTSSRYFQTHHADKQRRRAAAKSRRDVNMSRGHHHQRHHPDDVTRRMTSSPVSHVYAALANLSFRLGPTVRFRHS